MSLRIVIDTNAAAQLANMLSVSSTARLHCRGTDFQVYANSYDANKVVLPNEKDSIVLNELLQVLLGTDSGVTSIRASSPYDLEVNYTPAVDRKDLAAQLEQLILGVKPDAVVVII